MEPINILILEDEDSLRNLVSKYLDAEGYKSVLCESGQQALIELENKTFQLALLDVMLPDIDGWTVLKKIRETSKMPVIMLTARSDEMDKLFGFELGVDDYITKPFSPKELVARVKAVLSRSIEKSENPEIAVGNIRIHTKERQVYDHDKALPLTPIEYNLIHYLAINMNNAVSREMILDNVWGYDFMVILEQSIPI